MKDVVDEGINIIPSPLCDGSISNIYEIFSQSRLNLAKIQQKTGSIITGLKKFIMNVVFQKYSQVINTISFFIFLNTETSQGRLNSKPFRLNPLVTCVVLLISRPSNT